MSSVDDARVRDALRYNQERFLHPVASRWRSAAFSAVGCAASLWYLFSLKVQFFEGQGAGGQGTEESTVLTRAAALFLGLLASVLGANVLFHLVKLGGNGRPPPSVTALSPKERKLMGLGDLKAPTTTANSRRVNSNTVRKTPLSTTRTSSALGSSSSSSGRGGGGGGGGVVSGGVSGGSGGGGGSGSGLRTRGTGTRHGRSHVSPRPPSARKYDPLISDPAALERYGHLLGEEGGASSGGGGGVMRRSFNASGSLNASMNSFNSSFASVDSVGGGGGGGGGGSFWGNMTVSSSPLRGLGFGGGGMGMGMMMGERVAYMGAVPAVSSRNSRNSNKGYKVLMVPEVHAMMGVSQKQMARSVERCHQWLVHSILAPVINKIEKVNGDLAAEGHRYQIGETSLPQLEKIEPRDPALASLLPRVFKFLAVAPTLHEQRYLVQRLRSMARDQVYSWNAGGDTLEKGGGRTPWNKALPTDAQILFHCLVTYFDSLYPPNTWDERGALSFEALHVVRHPEVPVDLKKRKRHSPIYFFRGADTREDCWNVMHPVDKFDATGSNTYEVWEICAGRDNLFEAFVTMLWFCRERNRGLLDDEMRHSLDRQGLQVFDAILSW